ncbi:Ger(x)C family spore germination C-terminal domain-containing protein, partial [Paenibacillus sp. TAF58]
LWVIGEMKNLPIFSVKMPKEKAMFSVNIAHLGRRVYTQIDSGQVKIKIELTGTALVLENNTTLNIRNIENLNKFEKALNKEIEKAVLRIISTAQKQFKSDVFDFGETISRQHPHEWNSLKYSWQQDFTDAKLSVQPKVSIRQIGLQGPPLTEN